MALTVSFSVEQNYVSPSVLTLTDTSTGTDVAVVKKRIYLQEADGSYLVPSGTTTTYIETTEATLELDVLSEDKALNITVEWLNVDDDVLYDEDNLYCFSLYAEQYLYQLTQAQAGNPRLVNDGDYWQRKVELFALVKSAKNATALGADIYATQLCLDKAASYINNQTLFF
jgi:hypothetical protein